MGGSHLSEWAPVRRWPVRRRPPHSRLSLTLTASSRSRSSLSSFSNRSTSSGVRSRAGQRNHPGFSLTTSERTSRIWPTRRVLRTNGAGVRLSAPGLPGARRAGTETSTMQRTWQWTSHGTCRRVDDAARPDEGARRLDDLVGGKRVPVLLRERWCHQRNLQGSRCVSCQDGLLNAGVFFARRFGARCRVPTSPAVPAGRVMAPSKLEHRAISKRSGNFRYRSANMTPRNRPIGNPRFAGMMEAAGIEPASAIAPIRASTSLGCRCVSPAGRLAADQSTG